MEQQHRLCYISRNYYNLSTAGNKAKTDNEDTLSDMGAINLGLHRTVNNSKILAFFLDLVGVLRACLMLKRGDVLFLQYPVKKYFSLLCNVAKMKGAQTSCVIHDLGSFRRKKLTVEKEIARLSHCDYIIASNENMRQWLIQHGMKKTVGSLGLFDYRSASFNDHAASVNASVTSLESDVASLDGGNLSDALPKIVYAGALSMRKNSFLVELTKKKLSGWKLLIVGNKEGLQGLQENAHIEYRGFMPSEDFISHIDADFGLVWDGDSLDTCSGDYGEYLRWNSPHKVSFYLRAGLPVIIWKEAAVAPIIEQEGVGIAISSLAELDDFCYSLSADGLAQLKANAQKLAKKLNEGYFLRNALFSTF